MEDFKPDYILATLDSPSTGFEDIFSPRSSPCIDAEIIDEWIVDSGNFYENSWEGCISEDIGTTLICQVCKKNTVHLDSQPKKRRRTSKEPILSSMKLCESCKNLSPQQLAAFTKAASSSKLAAKREIAKRRVQETEALKKLKEEQAKVLEKIDGMPDQQKKKIQQKLRNRISAQQSRDRKKAYTDQLEAENDQIHSENSALKYRIQQLETENKYLRNQLISLQMKSSDSSVPRYIKASTLALATIVSVMLIAQSVHNNTQQTRQLIESFNLEEYRSPDGVSLQEKTSQIIQAIGISHEDFSPVEQPDSLALQNDLVVAYHNERLESMKESTSVAISQGHLRHPPLAATEPCPEVYHSEPGTLATLFCPSVQTYISDSQNPPKLQYVQLLVPVEAMPHLSQVRDLAAGRYWYEVMCNVKDITLRQVS